MTNINDKKVSLKLLLLTLNCFVGLYSFVYQAHAEVNQNNLAVSLALDNRGTLWRASVSEGFIIVDQSADFGKRFSKKVKVNQQPYSHIVTEKFRPKIAIGPRGTIYLSWIQDRKNRFTSDVWVARSIDGGKHFEAPSIVNQYQSEVGHAFKELVISPDGTVTLLWLDERDLVSAKRAGKSYEGKAVYYAVSRDRGKTFTQAQKLADSSCRCCRITSAIKPDGTVVALWRHVFEDNQRDYMIAEVPQAGRRPTLTRATFSRWKTEACPHQGEALARGGEGANWWGYHMAYFDGKDKRPGLYYRRMDGVAWVGSPAKKFGDNERQSRYPVLMSKGKQVWLAWLETAPDSTNNVMIMRSDNDGKSWTDEEIILSVKGKTGYPQLLKDKDTVYLAVNTHDGLKVIPFD